jgi:hypothetical protein
LRASLARRVEERRGDHGDHGDNNKGVVQNYESEKEREIEIENERREGSRESRRRDCEPRDTLPMSRAHHFFWLLSFVSVFSSLFS